VRPIYAILISIGLIAGVYYYIQFSDSVRREPPELQIDYAQGEYTIEIVQSFDCTGDPIFESESLKVMFKGETIFANSDPIPKDEATLITNVQGVEAGENEIFVSANMEAPTDGLGAMKVTVKRNDTPVAEKLLTSEPGLSAVSGAVVFTIEDSEDHDEHDH